MSIRGLGLLLLVVVGIAMPAAAAKKPCSKPLSHCPLRGCAKENSPNAFANIAKRNLKPSGDITRLSFDDFKDLQAAVEKRFDGQYSTLTKPDRARLRKFKLDGKTVGEGRLVEVVGFIADGPGKPHANSSGESVNCRISGAANNDFHISVTPRSDGTEFKGIVVEMVPQSRDENWTEGRLKKLQAAKLQVRVRGQLFLDNHHKVNDDPSANLTNQPKRMSLWEIHPVTEFDVCTKATCTEDGPGWKPFEKWQVGGEQ